jgi:hypothetical protein
MSFGAVVTSPLAAKATLLLLFAEFQSKGGDVKPKMNYESEFIKGETSWKPAHEHP